MLLAKRMLLFRVVILHGRIAYESCSEKRYKREVKQRKKNYAATNRIKSMDSGTGSGVLVLSFLMNSKRSAKN